MVEITENSRDSYLTIEFDTRLRSFAQFLKATADDGWLIASGKDIEGKLKIDSKYFEKRFLADTRHLKTYIKELTLMPSRMLCSGGEQKSREICRANLRSEQRGTYQTDRKRAWCLPETLS